MAVEQRFRGRHQRVGAGMGLLEASIDSQAFPWGGWHPAGAGGVLSSALTG